MRFGFDLYANVRPVRCVHDRLVPLAGRSAADVDFVVFRENTEGLYAGVGGNVHRGTPHEVAMTEAVYTRRGVERIVRAAFVFARDHGRDRVTLVDKANAMPAAGRLWRRVFREVAEAFPGIQVDEMYVDAMAMDLVRRPDRYQVVVTCNLFGDILSDLAAEITGGLGMAPSANLHPGRHALYEPVHGSAPDIAGQNRANPMGAIACAALVLRQIGQADAAGRVDAAVGEALEAGVTTADLGGAHGTEEVGAWIAARVGPNQGGEG